jgi:hypothetical protein
MVARREAQADEELGKKIGGKKMVRSANSITASSLVLNLATEKIRELVPGRS